MKKLPGVETLSKDFKGTNFAVALLNGKPLTFGDVDPVEKVFISNHIHNFEKELTYDRHHSRGFPKGVTDEMKKVQQALATVSFSTRSEDWFQDGMANLDRLKKQVMAPAEHALAKYASFNELENEYLQTYPFRESMKKTYPCFDSEASIARLVNFRVEKGHLSSEGPLELRIHSRFNPCFFCVQMLHHYAQRWVVKLVKPVRVFVSSHEEYHMPLEIMPEGHKIPEGIMINYGERVEGELTSDELNDYTYFPDKPGKIIQTFFKVEPVGEAAVAKAGASD